MTITTRYLLVLAPLATALLCVTIIAYTYKPKPEGFAKGSLLVQGLDPQSITRIKVRADGKETTLQRDGQKFVVAQRDNYPAAARQINDLLTKLLDIRCEEKVSDSAEAHNDLGVADDGKSTKVDLIDKDGKSIAAVIVGQPSKAQGNYVRLASGNTVYASKEQLWGITGDPVSYLQTKLTQVPADDIVRVTVKNKTGQYVISRDKDKKAQLQDPPAGRTAKPSDVEQEFNALTTLDLEDVTRDTKGIAWDRTYTCELKSGLKYAIQLGSRNGKQYLAVEAYGPSDEDLQKIAQRLQEEMSNPDLPKPSEAEAARRGAMFQARDAAKEFTEFHKGWAYKISDWQGKNMARPMQDLLEPPPVATKPTTASKPATATKPGATASKPVPAKSPTPKPPPAKK